MDIVLSNIPTLLTGFWVTLEIAVLSFIGALLIGTIVAVLRISPIAPLRAVGLVYVEFFRNIPLLCLLFLVVFGLPDVGVTLSLFVSAVVAMAMFSGAFVCESVRSGINTVAVGQAEAARSIGLTFAQSLRFVILPQAFRSMIQPLVNVWIGTLIGSTLASVIGIVDLTAQGSFLNSRYAGGLGVFASIAAVDVVIALGGLQSTLQITVVSGILALPLGVLFALLRLSHRPAIRWIATSYIEVFRSLPLLLLILVFVLALPPLGVNPPIFWKVVIPIVMCNVAVLAEIFRAGINAVPKGQTEAALAVGLTRGQAIREVVFPQAVRMIIPSLVTQLVSLLKDSTLGYAASFAELLRTAEVLTARLHIFIQVYIVISLIYIVINLLLSYLSRVLERRLNRVKRADGPAEPDQEVLVMSMETAPGGSLMR